MSKKIKDLIDKAEEDQETRAYLEKKIENLELKVATLTSKLDAKKVPFKIEPIRHEGPHDESEDIKALKEIITTLNKELVIKNEEKEDLSNKVEEITLELDAAKKSLSDSEKKDEMLLRTQNSLNNLIQDYARLEKENKSLKQKLSELKKDIEESTGSSTPPKDESEYGEQLKEEINHLKQEISIFEGRNKSLLKDLETLKNKSASAEELERVVKSLENNNLKLERENQILSEKVEALGREKIRILKYENERLSLLQQIQDLQGKYHDLKEKDAVLLAKTITALSLHEKKEVLKPDITNLESKEPLEVIKKLEKEKTALLGKSVAQRLKEIEKTGYVERIENAKDKLIPPETVELEDVPEFKEYKLESVDFDVSRKWQCPECGNKNKTQIMEMDDKTRIIYTYPKIYAKKYRCGQCGAEWH